MDVGRITATNPSLTKTKPDNEEKQLLDACKEFEAIMLQQMMKSMRATVPKSQMNQSFGQEITQEMYDEKLTEEMAKSGGIGLAQVIFRQLSRK